LALRAGKLPAEAAGAWRIWEDPPTGFVSDPGHLEQERRALEGYELDGPELQALRRLVRDLKADGVRVILVNMPVLSEEYDPLHENGRADHEAYLAAFDRVCAELAPECLDTMD